MPVPANPKIFHICHVDRLRSIIVEGGLLCDAEEQQHRLAFTSSNAGSSYFDNFCDLESLHEVD